MSSVTVKQESYKVMKVRNVNQTITLHSIQHGLHMNPDIISKNDRLKKIV